MTRRLRLLLWIATLRVDRLREHLAARRLIRSLHRANLWDPAFYQTRRADLAAPGLDLLHHYAIEGRREGLSPHPEFEPAWYAARNGVALPDAPLHFLEHGMAEGRAPNQAAAMRERQALALGHALQPGRLAIGIVTFNNPSAMLARVLRSVQVSASRAGIDPMLLMLDNGGPASAAVRDTPGLVVLPSGGNVGFGTGHNRLMERAFGDGATEYLALNPDAALHPDALGALLRMSHAAHGQALVGALQFPAEHQAPYDPATFESPWASGAALLIPHAVHAAIGGFDDGFFMYCEDVDLSWRARAAGLGVTMCPAALLFHPTTNRVLDPVTERMFLESGLRLALKWGAAATAEQARTELARLGVPVPDMMIEPVAASPGITDFDNGFSFAPARW